MSDKTDRTAKIFDWLGVTPETQPEFYFVINEDARWNLKDFLEFYSMEDADYCPYELLSGTLEADGLAVRLLQEWGQFYTEDSAVVLFGKDGHQVSEACFIDRQLAHAVHDALCAAMDAEKQKEETGNDV